MLSLGRDSLPRDARAARECVECDPLAEEQAPRGASHSRHLDLRVGVGGGDGSTLLEMPGDVAAELGKDLVDERNTSENALRSGTSRSADSPCAIARTHVQRNSGSGSEWSGVVCLTSDFPQRMAVSSPWPTTKPPTSIEGVSSASHTETTVFHEGGRR